MKDRTAPCAIDTVRPAGLLLNYYICLLPSASPPWSLWQRCYCLCWGVSSIQASLIVQFQATWGRCFIWRGAISTYFETIFFMWQNKSSITFVLTICDLFNHTFKVNHIKSLRQTFKMLVCYLVEHIWDLLIIDIIQFLHNNAPWISRYIDISIV